MGELWLFLLLPLPLAAFLGVRGCLECDPRFIKDIKSLLAKLVPSEVPGRTELLDRQIKAMTNLSFKVSHGNKMLRVLGVFILQGKLLDVRQNLESKLKEVLKHFSEAVLNEGPILDCWSCHQITTHCFKGEYCGEEDSRKHENREIGLFLILITEAVILGSALLLLHVCVTHQRKMKAIRKSLENYVEKKLEELMGRTDKKNKQDFGIRK
ncbi:Izumo sperm-egg fusion protein 3 [Myotis brandtii]|uniref:Izumo sperm-egg fusion protein 3 n=1 Tax=Myotis brandtii TaxID=109478 RepID=S7QAS2_MYOBR|nr:Izumo sperm-egg fusion protein 3 [Myotis brandtii]